MPDRGQPDNPALRMLCVLLIGAGLMLIGVNTQLHRWAPPPVPPPSAASLRGQAPAAGPPQHLMAVPMSRSVPAAITIPAIGVRARIIALGLDSSGGVAVPSLATPLLTSWYEGSSAPGQAGPAVLFGHVDSAAVGPAVFYRLGDLRPGDRVYVTRTDRRTAVFIINSVAMYSQSNFPSGKVYGFTPQPTLRLVTCGGTFDEQTHLYLDRIIAFAVYEGQEPASD